MYNIQVFWNYYTLKKKPITMELSSFGLSSYFNALLVGCLLVMIVTAVKKFRKYEATFNAFPGRPISHWFFGNANEFPGENEEGFAYLHGMTEEFPKFFRFWVGRFLCVLVFNHPDYIKAVLKSSAPKPRSPGTIYTYGLKWLGEGLLIANGQRWARNRRLLTPAFHFDILQPYADIHNKCTDILLNKLEVFCEKGDPFEAFEHIGLCSLDVICRCAFSFITEAQTQGDNHPYVKAVHRLSELWVKRYLNIFHTFDWVYFNFTQDGKEFLKLCDYVHKVTEDIIQTRRKALFQQTESVIKVENTKKRCLDFVDILLTAKDESGEGMNDYDIRCEVDTFLFEGHDTTTSGISYILLNLAQHQDLQDRVRDEIDDILNDKSADTISWSDLSKLEYLTLCIKEGLRLCTPVHIIQREMSEDLQIEEYTIPKGTNVIVSIVNLHHNPAVWGDSWNEYKPERFSQEHMRDMDSFAFVPFSGGPRNCIGQQFAMMEMKIIIARIIHRFRLETVPGHAYRRKMSVVMKAENGIILKVLPRK